MRALATLLPGLVLCGALATAGFWLADLAWVKQTLHLSALLLVILLGMAWKSLLPEPAAVLPGIRMAQRPILRWAVAGLGFRLSVGELWTIGGPALGTVIVSTFAALAVGWWIARRLGVPEKLGILLGVGSSICGASAVIAADSVVQGERRDAAVSLGIITLLGTIGIVLYPVIGRALEMPEFVYGVSDEAARVATVVKLARISLLAPVVLYLGWSLRHQHRAAGQAKVAPVPWFLVLFVIFAGINSLGVIPGHWLDLVRRADLWLLCVGMAGVGLQTGFSDLRSAGGRAIAAGVLQWLFLAAASYALAIGLSR